MKTILIDHDTGEQIHMRKRAADTDGAYIEFDDHIPAGLAGPPIHMHPIQTEHFEVLEGTLCVWVAGRWQRLGVGQCMEIAPGTFHTLSNQGLPNLRVRVRMSPALDAEKLFEGLIDLRMKRSKLGALLRLSWLLSRVESYFYFRGPRRLQRAFFAVLGWLAGILGVRAGQVVDLTVDPGDTQNSVR